ncbi:MAG TPA: sortase [Candidatus Paceibacterota bacterium]|nr:sortase [Candidatus Paceibacterota bacterium]
MAQTAFEKVLARKFLFAGVFTLVFFLTLVGLAIFGIGPQSQTFTPPTGGEEVVVEEGELPVGIEIPSVGIRASVANPESTDIATLDAALLKGAVRYPVSGVPGEEGNVLIFGHSSHLPVVQNQAYKAFNDIQKLEEGAPIYLIGEEHVYIYAVEAVTKANTSTGEIPLAVSGSKLTLATCDNFGSKSDRFIVTAELVRVEERKPRN